MSLATEGHASGHSLLAWLKPDRNPFYLITIAGVFTLTFSAHKEQQYLYQNWNFLYYLIAFILLINLVLSLFPQEIDKEEYDKNLRFARSLGITTATLSLIFLKRALENISITWVFILILIQILIFSIYLFIAIIKKNNIVYNSKKKINNFQLCLTTSALLMGIIVNYNYSIDKTVPDDALLNKSSLINTVYSIQSDLDKYILKSKEELELSNNSQDLSTQENIATIDKTELQSSLKSAYKSLEELKNSNSVYKIDFIERHISVIKLLLFAWTICMLTWLYQLKGVFNIKVNLNNPPD